jgi:gliding-associated putative ABC transporter substrate-binding component GldG
MNKIYVTTILIIVIVLVINLLSAEFHLRLDFTEGNQYTLSDATEDILESLEEPITVKAYFSKDLPPNVSKTRKDFQEMLVEYASMADGNLEYEFINPNESEATENEAAQNGIQQILINVREKDQVKQQKAFLGAVIIQGSKQEAIPFIQPGAAMEYALSTAIKKLAVSDKPPIGFLTGHGEPSLSELSQLTAQLGVLYTPQEITLSDTTDVPAAINTLVVIRPMDSIPAGDLGKLDGFLSRGGSIVFAINRVDGNLQNAYGTVVSTGLEAWLQGKGIEVVPDFVTDAKCGAVTVQQQTPFGMMQTQMAFPYLPIIGKFADHPVTKGLENVMFQFASTVRYVGDTSKRFTPLVFSSEKSNSFPAPLMFDINKQWTQNDLPMNGIILAGVVEGKISGGTSSKVIVFGDGDFPVNGQQRVQPDNVNLLSNAIDWLADDTGLIELRTKGVSSRPIDEMDDATKTIIKYVNFGLPLVLMVVYGIVRFQRNRIRRLKRMSENYEED